jgi:hypothetical protein
MPGGATDVRAPLGTMRAPTHARAARSPFGDLSMIA